MKIFAVLLCAGLALLGATSSSVGAAGARPHLAGIVFHHGRPSVRTNLLSLHASTRAARGSTATCNGSSCTSYEDAINQYFMDVAHDSGTTTNVYSVATQYSGITYSETFGGSYVDTNAYPAPLCNDSYTTVTPPQTLSDPICLTNQQLQSEIQSDISANHWPSGGTTNLFFIFTPSGVGICEAAGTASNTNACSTNVFCAYHSYIPSSGVIYAVQPYNATVPGNGCDSGNRPNGTDADLTLNTVSHEQNEAITNADTLNGWYTTDNNENGDLCAWTFGAPAGGIPGAGSDGTEWNQVINNHHYWLQQEYSNEADLTPLKVAGCVQHRGGIATANATDPTTNLPFSGPLVSHANPASVMTTNTVYAIYWVPGAAVVVALPKASGKPRISGKAKVGKRLTASSGSWSGSPASFRYQWLRCSAAGSSCARIAHATSSTYKVGKRDVKHRLRVAVTASNSAGSGSSTSAPTARVKR